MEPTSRPLFHRGWSVACGSYLIILIAISATAYLNLLPAQLDRIPHYDTFGHFFLLGIAAYLTHRALRKRSLTLGVLPIPLGLLFIVAFVVVDESLQALSPARTVSLSDVVASVLGILVFYGIGEAIDAWCQSP